MLRGHILFEFSSRRAGVVTGAGRTMGGFTLTSAAAVSARRLFNPRQGPSIARRHVVATPARAFLGKVKEMVRSVSSTAATGTGDTYTVTFCSN